MHRLLECADDEERGPTGAVASTRGSSPSVARDRLAAAIAETGGGRQRTDGIAAL
jgi:hypothetical protein